jgi:GTP-binding protein LepA
MAIEHTRNFCIIAHIDHGKTTLSDRLLERTGTIHEREKQDQLLDSMDLERERGITIKAHPVAMRYTRSRAKRTGSTCSTRRDTSISPTKFRVRSPRAKARSLIVDAAQGVEAQTVANVHLAHKQGLTIVPVINKIDLPNADIAFGASTTGGNSRHSRRRSDHASAKMGSASMKFSKRSWRAFRRPKAGRRNPARARLRFRLRCLPRRRRLRARRFRKNGSVAGDQIDEQRRALRDQGSRRVHAQDVSAAAIERRRCRLFHRQHQIDRRHERSATPSPISAIRRGAAARFPGNPSDGVQRIYPINTADFEHLKTAIGKLRLNDSAFIYTPESSVALGFGFRCGFLGLLHMEIIQERLRREYNMDIIATSARASFTKSCNHARRNSADR